MRIAWKGQIRKKYCLTNTFYITQTKSNTVTMKKKLVLWGTNAQDERVLIALQLHADTNKVSVYSFPENSVTEEFSKKMMDEWRNDQTVEFPENHTLQERELTVSESILPDDLKVERGDVVQRAQTEWHFIVLSSKLYEAYESELNELKDKVEELKKFDLATWDSLKGFWSKVQSQVQERNLFREHANSLRDNTNQLFSKLKEMRATLDEEFKAHSQTHFQSFMKTLEEVEQKVTDGLNLKSVFEDLKKMQREFKSTKFTKEHRSKVWNRMDAAFKNVKEKQYGKQGTGDNSPMERLKRRYSGLLGAIEKMERSIKRDRDDFKFQDRKIANSDGQLEQQIRQAKIKMIEERIRSKEEKLKEMLETKVELEKRMEKQKQKDAKQAERDKIKQAKEEVKAKIANQIKQEEASRSDSSEKLEKAASKIAGGKETKEAEKQPSDSDSMIGAISATVGEALEDVVDTVKAVAEVLGDKVEEAVADLKSEAVAAEDVVEDITEEVEEIKIAKEEEE